MLHRVPKSQPTYICQRTALFPSSENMVKGQRQCLTDTGLLKKRNTRGRERTQEGRLWRERTWSLKVATWLPKESTKVEEGSPRFTARAAKNMGTREPSSQKFFKSHRNFFEKLSKRQIFLFFSSKIDKFFPVLHFMTHFSVNLDNFL